MYTPYYAAVLWECYIKPSVPFFLVEYSSDDSENGCLHTLFGIWPTIYVMVKWICFSLGIILYLLCYRTVTLLLFYSEYYYLFGPLFIWDFTIISTLLIDN